MPASIPIAFDKPRGITPRLTQLDPSMAMSVATSRLARDSGLSQVQYLATSLDVQRIQNALRAAERGQTWLFFTIVRDMVASFTHLQSEWAKRKAVIIGQPMALIPADPANADDKMACKVIEEACDNCRNWQEGLNHLLDATLYPLAVAEKIYEELKFSEISGPAPKYKYLKRYRLKEIAPVNPLLFCFDVPYRGGYGKSLGNPATQFDADEWESWLRFYSTEPNGAVDYGIQDIYAPDESRHIIHRGNLLSPIIPPNFGGHIRAILFWWLFATQDRDWWTLMMAKYGLPIPVAKSDSSNKQSMQDLRSALSLGMQLGGIAIPKGSELEWSSSVGTDGSNAHKIYQDFANCEVSKIVVGQVTSARPEKGGLAGGMAEQAESVRDDIRVRDTSGLAWTLEHQLFPQILSHNGYRGRVHVSWGGVRPEQLKALGASVQQFYSGGMRPSENGLRTINQRGGIEFERIPDELMKSGSGEGGKKSRGKNSNDDGE